jgi:hypothetical protein
MLAGPKMAALDRCTAPGANFILALPISAHAAKDLLYQRADELLFDARISGGRVPRGAEIDGQAQQGFTVRCRDLGDDRIVAPASHVRRWASAAFQRASSPDATRRLSGSTAS